MTATLAASPSESLHRKSVPALRIRPVPRSEPLADDEQIVGLPAVARALPPDLATGVRVRREPGVRAATGGAGADTEGDIRSVPAPTVVRTPEMVVALIAAPLHSPAPTRAQPAPAQARPTATSAAALTVSAPGLGHAPADNPPRSLDLRVTAKRLLGTCIEVLGGFRPVAQLRPYCAPERFDAIVNRLLRPINAGRGHGATRSSLIVGRVAPGRPGRPTRAVVEDRIVVRRVQICDVMEGIAELAVVIAGHNKVWAMTMRLERSRGRWLCMHLEVL